MNKITSTAELMKIVSRVIEQEPRAFVGVVNSGFFDKEIRTTIYFSIPNVKRSLRKLQFRKSQDISKEDFENELRDFYTDYVTNTIEHCNKNKSVEDN